MIPPQELFSSILDELVKYTASLLHTDVSADALRTIGRTLAEQSHLQHKLTAPKSSAALMGTFVDEASRRSLWPCRPVNVGPEEVTFSTDTCPFGSHPDDVPQYCHLTCGFFGGLAVQYFDRAKVEVFKGKGSPASHCRVHVRVESLADAPSAGGQLFTKETYHQAKSIWPPAGVNLQQPLSLRELTILRMIGEGLTAKEIALSLHNSVRTIENTIARMSHKLGVRGRARLMKIALQYSNRIGHVSKAVDRSRP